MDTTLIATVASFDVIWTHPEDHEQRARRVYFATTTTLNEDGSCGETFNHYKDFDVDLDAERLCERINAAALPWNHVKTSPHWQLHEPPYGGCAHDLAPFGPAWEDEQRERMGYC